MKCKQRPTTYGVNLKRKSAEMLRKGSDLKINLQNILLLIEFFKPNSHCNWQRVIPVAKICDRAGH